MHENVPVRFGRGRLDSLATKGLAAYLIRGDGSAASDPHIMERGNGPTICIDVSCYGRPSRPGTTLGEVPWFRWARSALSNALSRNRPLRIARRAALDDTTLIRTARSRRPPTLSRRSLRSIHKRPPWERGNRMPPRSRWRPGSARRQLRSPIGRPPPARGSSGR